MDTLEEVCMPRWEVAIGCYIRSNELLQLSTSLVIVCITLMQLAVEVLLIVDIWLLSAGSK